MSSLYSNYWAAARALCGSTLEAEDVSPEEQLELARELASCPSNSPRAAELRIRLFESAVKLALEQWVVHGFIEDGMEEDAAGLAVEALMKAINSYDPESGKAFASWVCTKVYWATKDYTADEGTKGRTNHSHLPLDHADEGTTLGERLPAPEPEPLAPREVHPSIRKLIESAPGDIRLVAALHFGADIEDEFLDGLLRREFGDFTGGVPQLSIPDACRIVGTNEQTARRHIRRLYGSLQRVESETEQPALF